MDFQQKMIEYAKYGISVRTSSYDDAEYYMVSLTFGTKWKIKTPLETENQNVMCAKIKNDGTYCYMTNISNGMQPIFDLVDETIRYNEELEKKIDLLKVKAEELKNLFSDKTYEELLTLEFVIKSDLDNDTQKPKRTVKTSKRQQKIKNEPSVANLNGQTINQKTDAKASAELSEIDKKIAEAMNKK